MKIGAYVFTVILVVVVAILSSNFIFAMVSENKTSGPSDYSDTNSIQMNGTIIKVPAVDDEGKGLIGVFEVEAVTGTGKTLANIDNILFFVETQYSIQTAKIVAANVTGIDINKYNMIYDVDALGGNSTVVSGPSAGAALAIATIAELQGIELNPDVMITGTIRPDGTIGKIGGVAEKARATREAGVKVLLVPVGQGLIQSFKPEIKCEFVGRIKICRTSYEQDGTTATDKDGLTVKEVSNVREALKYFLQ
jgi:uncharacterized protein